MIIDLFPIFIVSFIFLEYLERNLMEIKSVISGSEKTSSEAGVY